MYTTKPPLNPAVMQVKSHDSYTSPTNIVTLKGAETTVCNKSETENKWKFCVPRTNC